MSDDPTRLLDDPSIPEALRADLSDAAADVGPAYNAEAGLERLLGTIGAPVPDGSDVGDGGSDIGGDVGGIESIPLGDGGAAAGSATASSATASSATATSALAKGATVGSAATQGAAATVGAKGVAAVAATKSSVALWVGGGDRGCPGLWRGCPVDPRRSPAASGPCGRHGRRAGAAAPSQGDEPRTGPGGGSSGGRRARRRRGGARRQPEASAGRGFARRQEGAGQEGDRAARTSSCSAGVRSVARARAREPRPSRLPGRHALSRTRSGRDPRARQARSQRRGELPRQGVPPRLSEGAFQRAYSERRGGQLSVSFASATMTR